MAIPSRDQIESLLKSPENSSTESRLVSLLGNIVEYSNSSQDDGVIKFFLRRFDRWKAWDKYWPTMEPFLVHCAIQFTHSFDYVSQIIVWRLRTDREIDSQAWKDVAQTVLNSASKSGRDSEALWAIWFLKELKQKIHVKLIEDLIKNTNPMVVSAIPRMVQQDLISGKFDPASLWNMIDEFPVSGKYWPLSLELNHLSVKKPAAISLDGPDALKSIFQHKCSLFAWDQYPPAFFDDEDELEEAPSHALGPAGSDYDDDDDDEVEEDEIEPPPF